MSKTDTVNKALDEMALYGTGAIYVFGNGSVEVDFVSYDDISSIPKDSPFTRIQTDPSDK